MFLECELLSEPGWALLPPKRIIKQITIPQVTLLAVGDFRVYIYGSCSKTASTCSKKVWAEEVGGESGSMEAAMIEVDKLELPGFEAKCLEHPLARCLITYLSMNYIQFTIRH